MIIIYDSSSCMHDHNDSCIQNNNDDHNDYDENYYFSYMN